MIDIGESDAACIEVLCQGDISIANHDTNNVLGISFVSTSEELSAAYQCDAFPRLSSYVVEFSRYRSAHVWC